MKNKLLELIKDQTDMYAYNEIINNNYSIKELFEILENLIMFNRDIEDLKNLRMKVNEVK